MSDHISSVSKSSFLSICDLRRIRNTLDLSVVIVCDIEISIKIAVDNELLNAEVNAAIFISLNLSGDEYS